MSAPHAQAAARLRWQLRRLRAMSGAEVAGRLAREARHRGDDAARRLAPARWRRLWEPPPLAVGARRPLGFLTAERAAELGRDDPEAAAALVRRADDVLAGRVRLLGVATGPLTGRDYHVDASSGYRWPDVHARRLDYRHAPADPKWIWELNRLQELPTLAAAWLLTRDAAYADGAEHTLRRWIGQQEPGRGIAWSNGFEAGLRAIAIAVAFDALAADEDLASRLRSPVLRSLWQHARWIERDPSIHSSANNHRIGELVGLLAIARLAPELAGSARRQAHAVADLRAEAVRQIRPDGTGAEQSFAYTVFVADLLLIAVALLDDAGGPPRELLEALGGVGTAWWGELAPGEPEPAYGDDDDGRALRLDGRERRTARGVAASIAARLGHPGARAVAGELDETARWLFGPGGASRFEATAPASPPGSVVLPDAGRAVLRGGAVRVGFSAGPLGYLSLAAHGHAAALAVTLSNDGIELVTDPGTGTYFGDPDVRAAFRGTGFHGTVVVDGRDQSEPGGPFLWTRHAEARITALDLDVPFAAGEHDGYAALEDPVSHRRSVAILGGQEPLVVVYDRLDARAEHRASFRWPLHEALTADATAPDEVRAGRDGTPALLLHVASESAGSLSIVRAQRDPFAGWSSRRLGELVPAPLVAWDTTWTGRLDVVTLLAPGQRTRLAARVQPHTTGARVQVTDAVAGVLHIDFDAVRGVRRSTSQSAT